MEAPNKIYATVQGSQLLGCSTNPYRDCEEYIRKDLLLEWLEAKVYEHNEDRFDDGFNAALGQVIDKLNSL